MAIFSDDDFAIAASLLVVLVCSVSYQIVSYLQPTPSKLNDLKQFQSPPSVPFLGILPFLTNNWDRFPEAMSDCFRHNSWKTVVGWLPRLVVPSGWAVYIASPENVQYILKDNFDNYVKGQKSQSLFKELLGDGIFATDGSTWKLHRKTTSNMFSRNLLRATGEVTLANLKIVESILAAKGDTGIDIQSLFFRMTFDTTCFVSLGCNIGSLLDDTDKQHPFAVAFDEMQLLTLVSG